MSIPDGYEEVASVPEGYEEVPAETGGSHIEMVDGVPTPTKGAYKTPPKKTYDINDRAIGAGEAALQGLSGAAMFLPGLVAHGDTEENKQFQDKYTYHPRTELGQEYGENLGDVFNQVGMPLAGLHLPNLGKQFNGALKARMPELKGKIDLTKLDEEKPVAKTVSEIPEGYEEVGPPTRDQDAMNRATADITYENVPPDGSIPTDEPNMSVPKGNTWIPDENNIPVRQGMPFDMEPPLQNVNVDQEHVHDMGNAIQEANGPKLGPDETYGAGNIGGPMGAPDVPSFPSGQRGAIDVAAFTGTWKTKDAGDGVKLLFVPHTPDGPVIMATKDGKTIGRLGLDTDTAVPKPSSFLEARDVYLDPEHRGKGIAEKMYRFASEMGDVQASSSLLPDGRKMWEGFEKRGLANDEWTIPRSQQGAVDLKGFHDAVQNGMDRVSNAIEKMSKISPYNDREKVVTDILGQKNYVPRGDVPADIIKGALAEGKDGPSLWTNLQSGLQSAGDKAKSGLMTGVARWLSYGEKMGERYYTNKVSPLERQLKKLSKDDLIAGQAVLRKGMLEEKEYTPEQLKSAGLSDKAIAAHNAMRQAFKDALDITNDGLRKLGKKEIKPQEAYVASMWHGNWHVPINDVNGKLAWYLKVESKAEANQAVAHLRKDPELSKTLNLKDLEPKYHPENVGRRVPADVMGAYQDMLGLFEGDTAAQIKEAMEAHIAQKGYRFQQHQQHFKNKTMVRGFQGDRPWLSDHANAMAQAKAQVEYLKSAYRWAPMQEALSQVKQVLSDPALVKQQPNNMEMAKAYTAQAMGVSNNLFKAAEQALQKVLTAGPGPITKMLPGNLGKFVGSLKNMTYLQQLGLSGGYMIATPLQAFLLGPARHLQLSGQGFTHSALLTSVRSLYDFSVGLIGHEIKNTFHSKYDMPMSPIGKQAFKYMEDNGIVTQNIFHEASGLGEYAAVHAAKQLVGWTISMPEKIARAATFMSFVHHLDASGKFTEQSALFRRAEELTNHTLTDFRRMSRPLAVDKMGQMGELAYTYKSPIFNQYNSLGEFSREALKGKPGPLLSALGMTALMGGMTSMPLVNEADEAWNLLKGAVAKTWPTLYPKIAGLGIKGTIISKMNEVSANEKIQSVLGKPATKFLGDTGGYGAVSAGTGAQMASRFSSAIGDVSNPLGNVAPAAQEVKEWVGAAQGMANPNRTNILQGIHTAIAPPAMKGNMEVNLPDFKTVKQGGNQGYANANKIAEHETSYVRTPEEENLRRYGMTSLQEATTKSARYINQQESGNFKNAQEASIDKMFDAITRKDKPDVQKYAQSYFANNGDGTTFERDLDHKLDAYMFTPEQRAIIKAQSLAAIQNVVRMRRMQGKANAN